MKSLILLIFALGGLTIATGCSPLSSKAKAIAGTYYVPQLSETTPIMELREDGSCIMRAIKPGVLTYGVEGEWDVYGDSLVASLDTGKVTFDGDSTLIGDIAPRVARKVLAHSDLKLELEDKGVKYVYQRRYDMKK